MKRWSLIPTALLGVAVGGGLVKNLWLAKYRLQKAILETTRQERELFYTWLLLEQADIQFEEYFAAHEYKTVAIHGMSRGGRRLVEELKDSEAVSVLYAVETDNFAAVHETLTVYRLGDDALPPADCIVICDLERIPQKLAAAQREFSGEIVSLAQVLMWLLERHRITP